jgi:ATP-dependent Clp protease adaptor protein ClpS
MRRSVVFKANRSVGLEHDPAFARRLIPEAVSNRRPSHHPEHGEELAVEERTQAQPPRRFRVLLHNDDFTTMEFVVDVLVRHFRKNATEATRVMLEVHLRGVGVAGLYPRDIAETKITQVTEEAREQGYPLLLTMEPE